MSEKIGLTASQSWSCAMRSFKKPGLTATSAYRAMMLAFRKGQVLPSVGIWKYQWAVEHPGAKLPAHCPLDWTPRGASYGAIMAARRKDPRRLLARALFGRGASNPKAKELVAKAHFKLERGTCTIKKEGK